jgi:hypothetical protein
MCDHLIIFILDLNYDIRTRISILPILRIKSKNTIYNDFI